MKAGHNSPLAPAEKGRRVSRPLLLGYSLTAAAVLLSIIASLVLPKGFQLALFGDLLQASLGGAVTFLTLQNALRGRGQVRAFWFLLFIGAAMWLCSLLIWSTNELWFHLAVPDVPVADILLFVGLVPLVAATALEPEEEHDSRFRRFGLLDLSILILYSLYLFAFFVYAYRLLPGAMEIYNHNFNVADAIGNQLFAVATGVAFFRERGDWRPVYRIFFLSAATYALASDLINVAIDTGGYYTGSLYDVPLVAAMGGFVCLCLAGRPLLEPAIAKGEHQGGQQRAIRPFAFLSSHLAMLVTVSTPAIGLWLLATYSPQDRLFSFRLDITLLTIFMLTLLLSIKQDFLSANLFGSLRHLSNTYSSIDRFKDHLVQGDKLASLGELVASVADQIRKAMTIIREQALRITSRLGVESRSRSLAEKIGQYAERTDALVENMQRFAQETPLRLAPLEVKPLLESALHLSRIDKLQNIRVELDVETACPPVLADSSQLLHVFLQIISNAMDALEEVGGGEFAISVSRCEPQVCIQFSDTGPGIRHPEHAFEPFFTTKPVGKGTGLGLSTCYGIIRQHDGDITCGNRLEGGAYFTIFLPAAALPASVSGIASSIVSERAG
ncbi:MAG TPA: ATP-binding protein [Candidatus Acidoferrales bacterium]|jgi:signal transduction histidine kinase|nr:ATP-binding protein [Candidatus Acidoferrales bacterium]